MGAFHSLKSSGLNFRKFPGTNGTVISGISGEENNLARQTEIFGNHHSMTLHTEFPERSVAWFAFLKFYNLRIFWKLSQEITVPLVPRFEIFKIWG